MATPVKSSPMAALGNPKALIALACVAAAVVVYLFAVGPLSERRLPEATRTPGVGAPLASAPHLVCGDAGTTTKAVSGSASTLDELALLGRQQAGDEAAEASVYQITLDVADEATAKVAIVSWKNGSNPDPVLQVAATKGDSTVWQLQGITSCA